MEKNKFILTGNDPYENKGCEAIVRGTTKILDNAFGSDSEYILESNYYDEESYSLQKNNEYDNRIRHEKILRRSSFFDRLTPGLLLNKLSYKFKLYAVFDDLYNKKQDHKGILKDLPECKAALCVGGDNYSLEYGVPRNYIWADDVILSYKKPCIIWGASVGPFTQNPVYEKFAKKHFEKVTAIFAREQNSVEYLNSIGLKDNVYRVSDPAFMMEPIKPTDFETLINLKDSIGINLSPLMAKYWADGDLKKWTEFCIDLVKKISLNTGRTIYLLPHVVHSHSNNDYALLKTVYESLDNKENIYLLHPNYTAAESKYIISNMSCFIGARTHATIAAFSTLVPTISIAYSMKAVGINQEVYNNLSYCVSKDKMGNSEFIADLVKSMLIDSDSIKNNMKNNLVIIQERAKEAGNIIKRLI